MKDHYELLREIRYKIHSATRQAYLNIDFRSPRELKLKKLFDEVIDQASVIDIILYSLNEDYEPPRG